MIIKINLYKTHDYDLCKLHTLKKINITKSIRDMIYSLSRNEEYQIPVVTTGIDITEIPKKIMLRVRITDEQSIEFLDNIVFKQRNSFIKNALRRCFDENYNCIYQDIEINGSKKAKKVIQKVTQEKPIKQKVTKPIIKKEIETNVEVNTQPIPEPEIIQDENQAFDLFGEFANMIDVY